MILVVDNYDSFTYNLVQALLMTGTEVEVIRNDDAEAEQVLDRQPDGLLLSPGPGRPESAGICPRLVEIRPSLPILGVCLGHQVLGSVFGGIVERSPDLMHGKTSLVRHQDDPLFEGLSNPFVATRYHSLELREESLAEELRAIAWADSGTLMGIRHRDLPYWGVQFHPESVLTSEGPRMLENFARICSPDDSAAADE